MKLIHVMSAMNIKLMINMVNAFSKLAPSSDLPDQKAPQIIPKVFHTIWFNFGKGDEVFPRYLDNMEKLKKLHPDWELKLWREKEIVELIRAECPSFLETFQNYSPQIKKHDAARIVILYCLGGVYLDHDFLPLQNIDPLLKSYKFVLGNEVPDEFFPVNGFIAATKGFGLLKALLDEMNKTHIARQLVLLATGPFLLKRVMLEYEKVYGIDGIKIYSNEFFYPVHWSKKLALKGKSIQDLETSHPNGYLVQEYDASWKN